ncbi:MAG: protein-L-isoaspartate O-methyltransferase [Pseudomonadota bacterium]|nr:protein-L-isoaspartate O-methyltransferase [Pseudomonadota bacterium]
MTINYTKARETMVEQQVRPWDVLDARVLETLTMVPRDAFVPEEYRALAYTDLPLPIGHGQAMMKPVVEGRMLQALEIAPGDEVLEIGTGSGFITACLTRLARDVVSLEIHPELATEAHARLAQHGYDSNVRIEVADVFAWKTERRFDAICVTAAVDTIPARFTDWLRPGGRLFVIRGRSPVMEAVCVRAAGDVNGARTESLFETDIPYLVGAAPVAQFQF